VKREEREKERLRINGVERGGGEREEQRKRGRTGEIRRAR